MSRIDAPMLSAVLLSAMLAVPLPAPSAGPDCHVRSGYDLTIRETGLLFERTNAPPQRLEMRGGHLSMNGAIVPLNARDRSRIAAFESTVRALLPRIRMLGQRAVDLSAVAVREEAASASPRSAADPRLNARVDRRARELKMRIANSITTKEWHGTAFNRYLGNTLADMLPLVAGDLAQQALEVAMRGDLAGAAQLTSRAEGLRKSLEARIRARLEVLQPDVARLCPALRRLDALESGLGARLPDGSRLNLIEIGR